MSGACAGPLTCIHVCWCVLPVPRIAAAAMAVREVRPAGLVSWLPCEGGGGGGVYASSAGTVRAAQRAWGASGQAADDAGPVAQPVAL